MKNTIKILSLLLVLFFASCKKDGGTSENGITGTWDLTALTCDDCTSTTEFEGTTAVTTFTTEGKDFNTTVTFKADDTYEAEGSYTAVQVITYEGTSFTQETPVEDFLGHGTYEVDGDKLTTEASTGEVGEATILSNANGVMELTFTVNQTISSPGNPTVTTTGTYFYTLEKQ